MENPVKSFFTEIKKLVAEYAEARLQLAKISVYEKIAKILSVFFSGLILMVVFFVVLVAFTLFLGAWLNAILDSRFAGFAIVAGIYFLGFFLLVIFRKKIIEDFLMKAFIKILFSDDEHNKN